MAIVNKYCIDTSSLIDAFRRWYPPDVFPPLWVKLESLIKSESLFSTIEVFHDIEAIDDDLLGWAKKNKKMFIPLDIDQQNEVKRILSMFPNLIQVRKKKSGSDPFVIALAKLKNAIVISSEKFSNDPNAPKIPTVCSNLRLRHMNLIQFFRNQNWTFTL
jgi:hypothetical protein